MYNDLNNENSTGLKYYIDDLNSRFESVLFKNLEGYTAKYLGLARLDINGIPMANDSGYEYLDGLMDDNYSLVLSYIESADRKDKDSGFEASVDLLVSANMDKFTGYTEEHIINQVYESMKVTSFTPSTVSRDQNALKGIVHEVEDSMYPFFVFRIKTKITGVY